MGALAGGRQQGPRNSPGFGVTGCATYRYLDSRCFGDSHPGADAFGCYVGMCGYLVDEVVRVSHAGDTQTKYCDVVRAFAADTAGVDVLPAGGSVGYHVSQRGVTVTQAR